MTFHKINKMKNLYYKIWADAIVYEKTKYDKLRNWKLYTLIPISLLQGINLVTIFFWLTALKIKINPFIHIDIFPGRMINSFFSGFITLLLPFLVINYFLIFRNNKYEDIVKKYKYKNGKLYLIYCLATILIFIIPIFIGIVYSQL